MADHHPTFTISVPAPGVLLLPQITALLHPGLFRERFGPIPLHDYSVSMSYDPAHKTFSSEGYARVLTSDDGWGWDSLFRIFKAHSIVVGKGVVLDGTGSLDALEVNYHVARPFALVTKLNGYYSLVTGGCLGMGLADMLDGSRMLHLLLVALFSVPIFILCQHLSRKRRSDLIESFHFAFSDAVASAVAEQKLRNFAA